MAAGLRRGMGTCGRERRLNADADQEEDEVTALRARIGVAALIGAVAAGAVTYRLIAIQGLQQTAALFVGIPALVAITVVFAVSPRSATGVACKAVTIGLLVSLVFLGEGMLGVMMSAPLFYAIAVAIASGMETMQRRRNKPTTLFSCAFLLAFVPMSLEGVTPLMTIDRNDSVTETKIVHASSHDVERAMFAPPRFDRRLPPYLRAGFPRGVATRIERGADGMRWLIQVRGGEMHINGMEPRPGQLALALEESRPGYLRWRAVSDTSHMTHFPGIRHARRRHACSVRSTSPPRDDRHLCLRLKSDAAVRGAAAVSSWNRRAKFVGFSSRHHGSYLFGRPGGLGRGPRSATTIWKCLDPLSPERSALGASLAPPISRR